MCLRQNEWTYWFENNKFVCQCLHNKFQSTPYLVQSYSSWNSHSGRSFVCWTGSNKKTNNTLESIYFVQNCIHSSQYFGIVFYMMRSKNNEEKPSVRNFSIKFILSLTKNRCIRSMNISSSIFNHRKKIKIVKRALANQFEYSL